ncbi:MAG: sigma-E processing peptidase SpoIIGA [Ruminococcaceae bacterium]|nr:sigma-E processing peptidase SpoIIGA [Oscillospiraceae bacterium]
MTVIYLDTLFVLNAIMDYLLLLCSARIAGEELHRLRMGLGAVLGGSYAAAAVLPGMDVLLQPPFKIGAAILMVVVGLGASRRLLRQAVIFFALSCAFGGGVLGVSLLGGQGMSLGGGVIYSGMDIRIVLLSAAGCYVLFTLGLSRWGRHTAAAGELIETKLFVFGRETNFTALLDTGNTLSDPLSGKAVMVADADMVMPLLSGIAPFKREELSTPDRVLERINTGRWRGRFRLIPYRAVGVECGLLLALQPDQVKLNGRESGGMLVALSPTPVSDGGNYRALVGSTSGKRDGI